MNVIQEIKKLESVDLFIICLNYQRFGRVMLKDIFLFLMVINFYLEYAVDS